MRRVISMPVAIIAALVMLAGFDSAARSDEQDSSSKYAKLSGGLDPKTGCTIVAQQPPNRAVLRAIYRDPYFLSGIVSGVSLESTTKIANRLAGSLSLAFSLIL